MGSSTSGMPNERIISSWRAEAIPAYRPAASFGFLAQRLARARAKIRNAGIPYRVPPADLLPQRLDALLAVIYLIFNEGYVTTEGDSTDARRSVHARPFACAGCWSTCCHRSAEARGLLALMLLHDSRRETRLDAAGDLVLLDNQDRTRWDRAKIGEGIAVLDEAMLLRDPGPYQVQAAISALHAEAATPDETDWAQIAALVRHTGGDDAVACGRGESGGGGGDGTDSRDGLALLHRIQGVENFYPYHVARADLLRRTNQREAAADAYERALALCGNSAEHAYLQQAK